MKKLLLMIVLAISLSSCGQFPLVEHEFNYLWPDGKIPYSLDENLATESIKIVERAIEIWESQTSIDFVLVDRTNISYHIQMSDTGNYAGKSTIGFNRFNYMKLKQISLRVVLHELGHCIGLEHEHQRPDRNKYITIIWENINSEFYNSYAIKKSHIKQLNEVYKNKPFDYNSIMNYGVYYNGKKVIESDTPMNRSTVSELDFYTVNELYK